MLLSILQLNINADNFWDTLIPFLTSNNFDILQLQELCGKDTFSGNLHCTRDTFGELQEILSSKYNSELAIAQRYTSSPDAYMGNATFYKKEFQVLEKHILTLNTHPEPFSSELNTFEDIGRNVLHIKFRIGEKNISFLNGHFAWAKTTVEQSHQTAQGEIFLNYLQNQLQPFVITGDFNLDPNQPLIKKISALSQNLIAQKNIPTTLNPRTHRAKVLFPPGAAVDYIFATHDLPVKKFEVLDEDDLSDHFALTAEIEI